MEKSVKSLVNIEELRYEFKIENLYHFDAYLSKYDKVLRQWYNEFYNLVEKIQLNEC